MLKLLEENTSKYGHKQGLSVNGSDNSRTYRKNRQISKV